MTRHLFPGVDERQKDASITFVRNNHNSIQHSPPRSLRLPILSSQSSLTPATQSLTDVRVPLSDSLKNLSSPSDDLFQVPVQGFLKRITRQKPLKKYGRQRRRIAETRSSSPTWQDDHNSSPVVSRRLKRRRTASINHRNASVSPGTLSPDTSRNKLPGRLRKTANTKARSLAERLFQASVMSNGSPADCLINPDILDLEDGLPSSRLPLQFVAASSGLPESKRRTWTLVDPKKAVPFRSLSFLPRSASLRDSEVISVKPLTRWRDALGSPCNRRKIVTPATENAAKLLSFPPLSFIPFQDAEKTYCLRQSHSNKFRPVHFIHTRVAINAVLLLFIKAILQGLATTSICIGFESATDSCRFCHSLIRGQRARFINALLIAIVQKFE